MAGEKFRLKLPELKLGEEGSRARLYVLLAILVLVSAGAIWVNFFLNKEELDEVSRPETGVELEIADLEKEVTDLLPQLERREGSDQEGEQEHASPSNDPFSMPMELVGVITGAGNDLAIIKARQTTYIATIGERIAYNWEVVEINRDSVRLKDDGNEIIIEFSNWEQ